MSRHRTIIMLFFACAMMAHFPICICGADFFKGADISWVPGQESKGIEFLDTLGRKRDIIDILKADYQLNTIRLRVFVNPSGDWGDGLCSIDATVAMAKRVKKAGMQLMLTLHYSDSWADPGKQNPPAAWRNFTVAQLETAVYNYTKDVMKALSAEGIYPVLVQIGNETNDGMLWPNGKASQNMANYAHFVTSGNNAVKDVSPDTKTVVHLANGFDNALYRWNIGGLVSNGAKFDVIGMSSYPEYAPNITVNDWAAFNSKVYTNVSDMVKTYGKPVIISETGMDYRAEDNCRKMISDLIVKMRSIKNQMGLGVMYWEPQAGPGYNRGYNLGAWGTNNQPTEALKGFIDSSITVTVTPAQMQLPQKNMNVSNVLFVKSSNLTIRGFHAPIELYQISGRALYKGAYSKHEIESIPDGAYLLRKNR
ncbi:MAG TPA: glycosyl hydrolase 53 family protein [Chitinispirillaceae bacterium]|nr:glycosyl hydrolase 53 family protein [Chitinispirillaceae bacterium]